MVVNEESSDHRYRITAYEPGAVTINHTRITRSLIVSANRLITDWRPQTSDELTPSDCEPLADSHPDIILFGTGKRYQRLPPAVLTYLAKAALQYEVMNTQAACTTTLALTSEGRHVVTALFQESTE